MGKTRISIKLNSYEYSALYRIQLNCIMMGLNYERAPTLNEIIRVLVLYVKFDITNKNENLNSFFKNIQMHSEYPTHVYHGSLISPSKEGNYIFIANDYDIELLKDISDITERGYHEKYDYPKIIRYCIHYVLYGDTFLYTKYGEITKKADFILITMIGNLYKLTPGESIDLVKNPLLDLTKPNAKKLSMISRIARDEQVYNSTMHLFIKELGLAEAKMNWPKDIMESMELATYEKYNSNVSDFNFLSVILGLGYITYMNEMDSFDPIMVTFFAWQKENLKNVKLPNGTFIPPKILVPLGPAIRQFVFLFNSFLRQSKKF